MVSLAVNAGWLRSLYDFLVCFVASTLTFFFAKLFLQEPISASIYLICFTFPLTNLALGIYGPLRFGNLPVNFPIYSQFRLSNFSRLALLSGSLLLNVLIYDRFTNHLPESTIWFSIALAPTILPRYFLNFHHSRRKNLLASVIRQHGPVLVVGGAGYIGSLLVERLLKRGQNVRVLDKFMYGKDSLQDLADDRRLELQDGDVTDISQLASAMNGASAVVHLSGLVGDPACSIDSDFTRHTNIIATRMTKEIAKTLGVPRFVFASSCSVYGISENIVSESSKPNPVSLYAKTKLDSENELLSESDQNFCVTVLRFATVFGHSRRPRFDLVANLFAAQAMMEGRINLAGASQWRPFIHVRDIARAIDMVLQRSPHEVGKQIFNVGDDELNFTIGQLAQMVQSVVRDFRPVEVASNIQFSDTRNYMVSFKKIQSRLGFKAEWLLEDGIREMVRNLREGRYDHYKEARYSNLHMAKAELQRYYDPAQNARLYRPLNEYLGLAQIRPTVASDQ